MTDRSPTDTGTLYTTNLAGTPGATLRDAREKAGLSIDEMATKTKIPLNVLQAIEHDDTAKLGQPVYVRGYLRRYAKALDVAETQVMEAFDSRPAARPPMPQPPPREPEPEEEKSGAGPLFWLAIIVPIAAIAGAGVLYLRGGSLASLMRRPAVARPAPAQRAPAVQPQPAPAAPSPEQGAAGADQPAASTSDGSSSAPPPAPKVAAPAAANPAVPGGPPPVEQPDSGAAAPAPAPQGP